MLRTRVLSVLSVLRCAQIRAPRMPAPLYGKYGAASRSLMVRTQAACERTHAYQQSTLSLPCSLFC